MSACVCIASRFSWLMRSIFQTEQSKICTFLWTSVSRALVARQKKKNMKRIEGEREKKKKK